MWFALHDATAGNGCMWGVPGTHKISNDYFMTRTDDNTSTEFVSLL